MSGGFVIVDQYNIRLFINIVKAKTIKQNNNVVNG